MKSVELAELAIDLRLKYKLDAELRWENKYPLTVFRSRQAESVKLKYDTIMQTYDIAVVKAHPNDAEDLEDYTEYEKELTRNEVVLRIVKVLGM